MPLEGFSVRNRRIVKGLDLERQVGLELGPLTAPVVRSDQAKHIFYLDHMSLEDLKKKYEAEPIDPDAIVAPDFVLQENSISKTVKGKKFDYVIASHVIEHIPDTVSWLKDVASVLKRGGVLKLVVPDKRFTFDLLRSPSVPGEVIDAYERKLQKPTTAMIYDYASKYAKNIDTASIWRDHRYYEKKPPVLRWTEQQAMDMCRINVEPEGYIDCHCYVYTPQSFLGIMRTLIAHELIDFEVTDFMKTQPFELEFFVTLKKVKIDKNTKRQILRNLPRVKDNDFSRANERALEEDNKILNEKIAAMTHSSSWKVTRPLRFLKRLWKGR